VTLPPIYRTFGGWGGRGPSVSWRQGSSVAPSWPQDVGGRRPGPEGGDSESETVRRHMVGGGGVMT
jgi:hypothetical protein